MDSKFYVSLEAARLLKEKGCDIERDFLTHVYNENGHLYWSNYEDLSDKIPAYTKDEVIDWLESKGIMIDLHWIGFNENRRWNYSIFNCNTCDTIDTKYILLTRLQAADAVIIKALELLQI